MAFPDLTVYREDVRHTVAWRQDPPAGTLPGRFIDDGIARVDSGSVERGLHDLVESVLARLDSIQQPEIQELREDWAAAKCSRKDERELCERLAALGLDPYAEMPENIEARVASLDLEGPTLRRSRPHPDRRGGSASC